MSGKVFVGSVISVAKNGFHVLIDGKQEFCLINNSFKSDVQPIVNDTVELEKREDKYFITNIQPRKNFIARYDERYQKHQYFAANIDIMFIVTSANREFSVNRLKRFSALAEGQSIQTVIVLTKTDLKKTFDTQGIECVAMNALDKNDAIKLYQYWKPNETAMLVGSSGVGKSTIINTLCGLDLKTNDIMGIKRNNLGKHTTSARTLYLLPCGRKIIDNPGVRSVSVENV